MNPFSIRLENALLNTFNGDILIKVIPSEGATLGPDSDLCQKIVLGIAQSHEFSGRKRQDSVIVQLDVYNPVFDPGIDGDRFNCQNPFMYRGTHDISPSENQNYHESVALSLVISVQVCLYS